MKQHSDPMDPKGLIREAYRIDGIGLPECRSIFLDWALSIPSGIDQRDALQKLHGSYGAEHPDHPMTQVMAQGLDAAAAPKRRGGWRARPRG